MTTLDFRRGQVGAAYMSACQREGIAYDPALNANLLLWGCHRDDWYDDPVVPAETWDEHEARRRVVETVLEAEKATGETMPDDLRVRMLKWIHDVAGWNA